MFRSISAARRAAAALVALLPALASLSGCSDEKAPTCAVPDGAGQVIIVTNDASTGALSAATAGTPVTVYPGVQPIHPDAVVRAKDGLVYVVNRFGGDNIQVVDPSSCFGTVRQFSVGPGSNPHDIAVLGRDRAYVALSGSPYVLEVNPATGAIIDSISLAGFADPDGNPDLDRLFYRDPFLYVSIERIDFGGGYQPVPPSLIGIIDTRTNALVDADPDSQGIQAITLEGLNPTAPMVWDDDEGVLLVPEAGKYYEADGGVEKVDLASRRSAGWLVRGADLGGDLTDFVLVPGGRGYATIAEPGGATSLIAFDAATGAPVDTIYRSATYDLADVLQVPSSGLLLVCDRNATVWGLRVFHASDGTPVTGIPQPIPTGLPPFELILME